MSERITSRRNRLVLHYKSLLADKKYRYENRAFVCDGIKLLNEAIAESVIIRSALIDERISEELFSGREPRDFRVYTAPREIIEAVSTLSTPQGVLFECEMPAPRKIAGERFILLDGLQDTGNIGTIIRCADALSIDAVICDGCADIYNPKVVRSAMGSLFRVNAVNTKLPDAIPMLHDMKIPVYAARLEKDSADVSSVDLTKCAVIIGNEGAGVRDVIAGLCDGSIVIPMSGRAESLNAALAAAIIMYEMTRGKSR
jgi:TrmH family RNA methyltransferase